MTFGIPDITDGISFVPIAIGLFGIAEMIRNLEQPQDRDLPRMRISNLLPTRADLAAAFPAMLRGTSLGCLLGVLPGGGAALPPFSAYALEKKIAADPSRFGKGAIEGVAAPEAANNAGAQTSFVPMLTPGPPTNPLRGAPEFTSTPTRPTSTPTIIMAMALAGEPYSLLHLAPAAKPALEPQRLPSAEISGQDWLPRHAGVGANAGNWLRLSARFRRTCRSG